MRRGLTGVPIRLRVAGAFAVAMAVLLVAVASLLYLRVGNHLSRAIDDQLRLRAEDLAALVRGPAAPLAAATAGPLVERGENYAQLLNVRGRVIDATSPLGDTPLLDDAQLRAAQEAPLFVDRGPIPGLDEPSRMLATAVVSRGEPAVLVVGSATREERAETLAGLRNELLLAGPIALLLATAAGYALAGIALQPVEFMRRRASEISAETPGERLPVSRTGDELERLGNTLNSMLTRLETAIARERDLVADAGHELRTPLALLRAELELALRHAASAEELRDTIARSVAEVDRLAQLADDLLLIARFDQGRLQLRLELWEPREVLTSVARRFEWRAREDGRSIIVEDESRRRIRADRLRIEQALGNLVDNALRHGSGRVRLSARAANGAVALHVTDEGPGLPSDFLPDAFERFARSSEARSRGGSGLGLSIVRVIAEAHGGSAHLANRTGGGTDAWVILPSGPRGGYS